MIKFVKQKNRENSAASTLKATNLKNFLRKKRESNDSGTESDGDILDVENKHTHHLDLDMETSASSSCTDAHSPITDTACPAVCSTTDAASATTANAMMCQSHLLYDQHSSEEELEVINGPSAVAAAEAQRNETAISSACLSTRGCRSSLDTEELYERDSAGDGAECAGSSSSKRASSTLMENRKRSLAHSSDDELRNFLEPILTPVNFRTSPPLEAFKPNRSHMFRSTTPLILSEARCGIENIKLCDNSVNEENGGGVTGANAAAIVVAATAVAVAATAAAADDDDDTAATNGKLKMLSNENEPTVSMIKACNTSLKLSNSSHLIYQPQPKYNFHYNSSRSSPASTTGFDMEVRSVSPPAKLFHCAISPRRRPMRATQQQQQQLSATEQSQQTHHHHAQRLQRPHRPCLDFDKMQQVSL